VDGDGRIDGRDGASAHAQGTALAFEVVPARAFAFVKGDVDGQTRYRWPGG
jgi:hypothetical protein